MDANYSDDAPFAVVLPFKKPEPKPRQPAPSERPSTINLTTHRLHTMYGLLDRCSCFDCRLDKVLSRGRYAPKRPDGKGA